MMTLMILKTLVTFDVFDDCEDYEISDNFYDKKKEEILDFFLPFVLICM